MNRLIIAQQYRYQTPMEEKEDDLEVLWNKFRSTMDDITKAVCHALGGGKREKLPHINTLSDVVTLIEQSSRILVLTGAGISVSAGIPDFRSENGLYEQLKNEFNLSNPKTMFDLKHFIKDGGHLFYSFFKQICAGFDESDIQYFPTKTHDFIQMLESKGKLLRNYTQNIDSLEMHANIERVVCCHGSYQTASCMNCGYKIPGLQIKEHIFNQSIPFCPYCCPQKSDLKISKNSNHGIIVEQTPNCIEVKIPKILTEDETAFHFEAQCPSLDHFEKTGSLKIEQSKGAEDKLIIFGLHSEDAKCLELCLKEVMEWLQSFKSFGVMKLDIVFFGESLPSEYEHLIEDDIKECDLLIVMGTSLRVQPVASIPCKIKEQVPAILINKESCSFRCIQFDVNLLGHSDDICQELTKQLKWSEDNLKSQDDNDVGYEFIEPNHYIFPNGNLIIPE